MKDIGEMRHRIKIQELVRIDDGYGGAVEDWVDIANIWAKVEPLRGEERYTAQQIKSELTHKITIRFIKGIKPQMRVIFNDRIFNIESTINIEEKKRYIELMCIEVIDNG